MGLQPYPGPIADRIAHLPEAASQTFKKGDLVIFSSGYIAVATHDDDVFGVALAHANNSTAGAYKTPVYVIHASDKFIAEASTTTAQTNCGVAYALVMTSGSMAVNPGSTTTAAFYIEDLDPDLREDFQNTHKLWLPAFRQLWVDQGSSDKKT